MSAWVAAVLIVLWEWHVTRTPTPRREVSIDPGEILLLNPEERLLPYPVSYFRHPW